MRRLGQQGPDRLTAVGSTAVTFDAAGNLTARGADTFAHDAPDRLVSATVAGAAESYGYDGDGVRVSRRVGVGRGDDWTSGSSEHRP